MHDNDDRKNLGIPQRAIRSRGRDGRIIPASTKVNRAEQHLLQAAAKREGKAVSEWAREVLLSRAQSGDAELAVFTELIALRLLMNAVLRSVVIGKPLTEAQYQSLLTEVRQTKHVTAREVLSQYQRTTEGAQ